MDKTITTTTTTTTTTSSIDQTHDFMSVDSFSQLPFLRPSPSSTKDKSSPSAAPIRLFGIDFSSSSTTATDNSNYCDDSTPDRADTPSKDENNNNNNNSSSNNNNNGENGESGRKFECHYCCRNFPTSQALGGHQNAHKRERQHAKRAHLHSAMMAADPHNHHLYNHLVSHRPTAATTTSFSPHNYTSRFSHFHTTSTTNPTTTTLPSNYSNLHHHHLNNNHHHLNLNPTTTPTINGNPLLWRIPATVHPSTAIHRDRSLHHTTLPYFNGTPTSRVLNIDHLNTSSKNSMSSSSSQVGRRGGSDHVSLDLRL